jgi:hypothetical protein
MSKWLPSREQMFGEQQAKEINASYREVEMANRRDFLKAVPAAAGAAALIMQGCRAGR